MELQCKERVDLLDALKKSRDESEPPEADGPHAFGEGTSAKLANPSLSSSSTTELGKGTVAPVDYPDIGRPPLPQRPAMQVRQPPAASNGLAPGPSMEASRSKSSSSVLSPSRKTPSPALEVPVKKQARTPSPDKKPGLLRSTLRPHGSAPSRNGASGRLTAASLRPKPAAPASKAATLAWPGSSPSLPPASNPGNAQFTMPAPVAKVSRHELGPPEPPYRRSAGGEPLQSSRPAFAKLRPKKARASNGPALSPDNGPSSSSPSNAPPPPPPHREPISRKSSQDHLAQTNGLHSPLTPAEFPAYRREYSAVGAPAVDSKAAQRMAANLHGNLSSLSRTAVAPSPQLQPATEAASSVPHRKKPPPPVPRKAVGSPRKLSAAHARTLSDATAESSTSHDQAHSDDLASTTDELADSESATDVGAHDKTQDAAWDARVKQLMKNLPKGVDEQAAKAIFNEVVIQGDEVHWDDVAGLDIAKTALKEAVVYPFLRPDLFRGLREPARGMLLFGPPGTGKTMLARAVATESRSTFFAISASSLTSKYLGESEKLVRALFEIAKVLTPSIIFVDEIDSLLSARSGSGEHEATRRIKTEFLIQWSDLAKAAAGREDKDKSAGDASRVLVLAATNLPWAIDEAARRRFVRRQYIPLPEAEVRESQLQRLLSAQKTSLDERDLAALVALTDGKHFTDGSQESDQH